MIRKLLLAAALAVPFTLIGLPTEKASAQRLGQGLNPLRTQRGPLEGVFYYYNGPARAFTYPAPIRRLGRPYYGPFAVGPYGPGYGWPNSYYSTYIPYNAPRGVFYTPDFSATR
jgi:hypothetical protein